MKRKRKLKVQNEICDASARARVPPNPLFQVLAIKVGHPLSVETAKRKRRSLQARRKRRRTLVAISHTSSVLLGLSKQKRGYTDQLYSTPTRPQLTDISL